MPLIADAVDGGRELQLDFEDEGSFNIPVNLRSALLGFLNDLSRGQPVAVVAMDSVLTTQAAADLLNVSRPHLIKLLKQGALPFELIGSHRRIKFEDAMAFRARRYQERQNLFEELAGTEEEYGLE